MTAEIIIFMVIVVIGSVPLVILGIFQYRSKEPVGFWSGHKPPKREQITDMKAYNQKHGVMWILYGTGLFLCSVLVILFGERFALAAVILAMVECIGGILVMVWYHNKLNKRYLRRN